MDILTALEAAHSPLSTDELKAFCGVMFTSERLETLIRSGDVKLVPGLENVYWSVPAALKKRGAIKKCQSPMKAQDRKALIKQVVDLRTKITMVTKELDALMLKKDSFPTQEQLTDHMNRLHRYNEIKDSGMAIIGHIADLEKVQAKEVYERYGLSQNDDEN